MEVLLEPTNARGDLMKLASRFAGFLAARKRVWCVFTYGFQKEREAWIGYLKHRFRLEDEYEIADASVHLFVERSTQSIARNDTPAIPKTQ